MPTGPKADKDTGNHEHPSTLEYNYARVKQGESFVKKRKNKKTSRCSFMRRNVASASWRIAAKNCCYRIFTASVSVSTVCTSSAASPPTKRITVMVWAISGAR